MLRAVRRFDMDWLRIGATLLLILFHTCKVFDTLPFFHIKNNVTAPGLNDFTGLVHLFHMPLFFLLAGWAAYGSLMRRGTAKFLGERFRRLFIPFIVGTLLFGPFMKYAELKVVFPGTYDGSFIEMLPKFLTDINFFTWGHFWFLIYLFVFCLLYAPALSRFSRWEWSPNNFKPWSAYLPVLPLIVIQLALRHRWPGYQNLIDDWANFLYYSSYLVIGFTLAKWPKFEGVLQREWKRAGILALLILLVLSRPDYNYYIEVSLSTAAGWFLIVFMLGMANRFFNGPNPAHGYLVEGAFPIYILHQPIIIAVGWWVIGRDWSVAVKLLTILVVSSVVTFSVYHAIVRPFDLSRKLMGMGVRTRSTGGLAAR